MNEFLASAAEEAAEYALLNQSGEQLQSEAEGHDTIVVSREFVEKFAELIVSKTLDEVEERAHCSGDRAWSDDLDRKWVELVFGFGELAGLVESED